MRILIVDDEKRPAQFIARLLRKNYPQWKSINMVHSISEAIQFVEREAVDLVFLDVELPDMNGFDFLENLSPNARPLVIFTTGFPKYAVDAFRVNAVDYLLKPILPAQLIGAVEKARKVIKSDSGGVSSNVLKITLYEGQSYHIVPIDQIIRIEADGSYTRFTKADGQRILNSKQLKYYEELLAAHGFIRCHKSHLVNLNSIKSYTLSDGGYLNLTNGDRLPLAASRKNTFLDRLNLA